MRPFSESATCATRRHCVDCRSSSASGQAWRVAMGQYMAVPSACPHGVPLDVAANPPAPVSIAPSRPNASTPGHADPLMVDVGPKLWAALHREPAGSPEFLASFSQGIPCGECRAHWLRIVAATPPVYGDGWLAWTVNAHNQVNAALGKPAITLSAARARWSGTTA